MKGFFKSLLFGLHSVSLSSMHTAGRWSCTTFLWDIHRASRSSLLYAPHTAHRRRTGSQKTENTHVTTQPRKLQDIIINETIMNVIINIWQALIEEETWILQAVRKTQQMLHDFCLSWNSILEQESQGLPEINAWENKLSKRLRFKLSLHKLLFSYIVTVSLSAQIQVLSNLEEKCWC